MHRLALYNSVARDAAGYHAVATKFPPLGLQVLAAGVPAGWEVRLFDESLGPNGLEAALRRGAVDLLAATCFTSGAPRAYEVARAAREAGVPSVMGGVHATFCAEEAGAHFDSIALGECDAVWPEILTDAAAGRLRPRYHGSLVDLGATFGRARQDLVAENGRYNTSCIQTARGCPVGCRFCSVTNYNGHRIRHRDPAAVLDEWNAIRSTSAFVVDDNFFGVGPRDLEAAKALLELLIRKGRRRPWFSQTTLQMGLDAESLRLAHRAGCAAMLVGFESFSPEVLRGMHKGINRLHVSRYRELVEGFHRAGIAVIGGFVIGADGDGPGTAPATAAEADRIGIDFIQMTQMTPLPGTPLFDELRTAGRLLTSNYPADWERHSFTETVFRPRDMTAEELDRSIFETRKRRYWRAGLWPIRVAETAWKTRSLLTTIWSASAHAAYARLARVIYEAGRARFEPSGAPAR